MSTRRCPKCGRTLDTRRNRLGIEMWPQHKYQKATAADLSNRYREPGRRDWEVPCDNSAQPVED